MYCRAFSVHSIYIRREMSCIRLYFSLTSLPNSLQLITFNPCLSARIVGATFVYIRADLFLYRSSIITFIFNHACVVIIWKTFVIPCHKSGTHIGCPFHSSAFIPHDYALSLSRMKLSVILCPALLVTVFATSARSLFTGSNLKWLPFSVCSSVDSSAYFM